MTSTTSFAADLPVKAVAVPPSVYNWTGVYVGGHVGYGIGMKDWLNSSFDYQVDGFLGGGQIKLQSAGRQSGVRHRGRCIVEQYKG